MRRLVKFIFAIVMLPLLLMGLFSSVYFTGFENQKPWIYIISMQNNSQSNLMNVFKLVNELLYLNKSVYWLAEPLTTSVDGVKYALASGDFIVPFCQSLKSDVVPYLIVSQDYFEKLSTELGVTISKIRENIEARLYPLKPTKVAVFYGGGVTGGALEHLYPLEEAGFSPGIVREENLRRGELSEYNVMVLPGGGPYEKYLSEEDMETIRDFVKHGGGFFGTCGGSMLGIELGLLNAEAAMAGQYAAYADLRGPVLLNLTKSSNPIVFGCSTFFKSTYLHGPLISRVGSNVETIGSYHSPTKNFSLYFPEIAKAYNFTPQTEVINNFWGSPSIIAGKYGAGKVVLSTVHPDILPNSQKLFINSIFYLSSGDEVLLKTSQYPLAQKSSEPYLSYDNLGVLNKTLWSQVRNLTFTINERSSNARGVLTELEESNNQIVGLSGEYLMLYLGDIKTRSADLLAKYDELGNVNKRVESVKTLCARAHNRRPLDLRLSLIYRGLMLSMERLQSRILNIQNSILNLSVLPHCIDVAEEDLLNETSMLRQILSGNMSSAKRNQQIIDLNAAESLTLCKLKDDVDYYLLNLTFAIESVLIDAGYLSYVIDNYV